MFENYAINMQSLRCKMRCGAKNEETKKSPLTNSGLTKRFFLYGGAKEDRTPDPLLAKQVLSQLSYNPTIQLLKYIISD